MSERKTHLIDWLNDGWTHCQHGTREWCEGYLHNARDVIKAHDGELSRLSEALEQIAKSGTIAGMHEQDRAARLQDIAARALSEREGQE